jgi:hypothetical protein
MSPFVDLTFAAFCRPVLSFIQLNSDSTGCLILETAVEKKSLPTLLNSLSVFDWPFLSLTGV